MAWPLKPSNHSQSLWQRIFPPPPAPPPPTRGPAPDILIAQVVPLRKRKISHADGKERVQLGYGSVSMSHREWLSPDKQSIFVVHYQRGDRLKFDLTHRALTNGFRLQ